MNQTLNENRVPNSVSTVRQLADAAEDAYRRGYKTAGDYYMQAIWTPDLLKSAQWISKAQDAIESQDKRQTR